MVVDESSFSRGVTGAVTGTQPKALGRRQVTPLIFASLGDLLSAWFAFLKGRYCVCPPPLSNEKLTSVGAGYVLVCASSRTLLDIHFVKYGL